MPYMLGAFGARCTHDYIRKLSHIANQRGTSNTTQTVSLEKRSGMICAGYKQDETYHHNNVIPLHHNHGMLIGKIFDRNQHKPVQFDQEQTHVCITDPHYLSTHFWGRYIGALVNPATHELTLVRDPQGLSTLFYHATCDGIVFSNELALLYEAIEIKPTINLNYFAQHLIHTNQALSSTPFEGIHRTFAKF